MSRVSWPWCLLVAGWAAALLLAQPAHAHRGSESRLALTLQANQISADWQISLHDLAPAGQPGAAPETLAPAQAWLAGQPGLAAQALATLQLRGDGKPCPLQIQQHTVLATPQGLVLALQLQGRCPGAPAQLAVDYRLLMDTDPRHQGLLSLRAGALQRPAVFTAQSPSQVFLLHTPGRWPRLWADLRSGIWHIWTGPDHLLFLLCLLLPAVVIGQSPGRAGSLGGGSTRTLPVGPVLLDVLKVVTAFTLAHSITLSAAALHWINLPARLTESLIAASVVLAAGLNLLPVAPLQRWQAAFGFGLVHGVGLASALDGLALGGYSMLPTLLAFNLGVEAGQLVVVAALLPLAYGLRQRAWYRPLVLRAGSVLVACIGLLWLAERAFDLRFMPIH